MMDATCVVCARDCGAEPEEAVVHSNVRRFKDEAFSVWRCPHCGSIHARDDVDLAHYYDGYPFHRGLEIDWRVKVMYASLLRRLARFGFRRENSLLDYGCGGGAVIRYLSERGFERVSGYDEFSDEFDDRSLLERRYDLVLCQDVVEHVPDPNALLDRFGELVSPGGLIAVGTPNATAIELAHAGRFRHTLHQPFHRHILSERALLGAGERRGWKLLRYYPTMYINTLFPFVNQRFVLRYFRCFDDTLDVAFDPPSMRSLRLFSPSTLFLAFFGYFFAPKTDVMAVFRRSQ